MRELALSDRLVAGVGKAGQVGFPSIVGWFARAMGCPQRRFEPQLFRDAIDSVVGGGKPNSFDVIIESVPLSRSGLDLRDRLRDAKRSFEARINRLHRRHGEKADDPCNVALFDRVDVGAIYHGRVP